MDRETIYTKSTKGLMEATGKTSILSHDLRIILKQIDGRTAVGGLSEKLARMPDGKLEEALGKLAEDNFICEFAQPASAPKATAIAAQAAGASADADEDLDFTALVSKPEAKSVASLDDFVKFDASFDELPADTSLVKNEVVKTESAENEKRNEAQDKTRREAEEKAEREAAESARREATERARRDAEEQARKDAEETARREAEEREQVEALAWVKEQEAETERHFAAAEKEIEAERAVAGRGMGKQPSEAPRAERKPDKEQAVVRARAESRAEARAQEAEIRDTVYKKPINWGKPVMLGLFLLLAASIGLAHVVSFDGYIPRFEKLAGEHLQLPVKIEALHLSLLPQPHWKISGVKVGTQGELSVAQINAVTELGTMFSDKKAFKSIELDTPVVSEEGLTALLFGRPRGQDFKVARVLVKNGKLDSKTIALPALDAKIAFGGDGNWQKIVLETPDRKTTLQFEAAGADVSLELDTNAFASPFGATVLIEDFSAKGALSRGELRLAEFKGRVYGGYISGNATLAWSSGWSLGGQLNGRQIDVARIAASLIEEGKLEGKSAFALRAKSYDELFSAMRLEGNFAVTKGALLGVDMGRLVQGAPPAGRTPFAELAGTVVYDSGRVQLRQMRLSSGPITAGGAADVDAGRNLSGRFAVELKSQTAQGRANLTLAGTLREPRYSR